MENQSKHPLETSPLVSNTPHKNRFNLWFLVAIVFIVLSLHAGMSQNNGSWQPLALFAVISIVVGMVELITFTPRISAAALKELSAFELAQIRLKKRQRKKVLFIIWIVIFCVLIGINIQFGGIDWYWNPLEIFAIFMMGYYGLQLFYHAPERVPKQQLIENEMLWLFGEDWKDFSGPMEYTFAQDRIRRRQVARWGLYFHLFLFIPINGFNVFYFVPYFLSHSYGEPLAPLLAGVAYGISGIWMLFLLSHAINTFPTLKMLARRERKIGKNLQMEIDNMYPSKAKNGDKPKHNVQYKIGDDGELIEVDAADEKPKRQIRGDD